ncbi:hypothetical protein IM40_03155 [Candidatus Paracaedimonas acanthamoebae]|nr:hypothetical protein IM40_03155 [Candidatus Paracaedimonas acanthamoebae]
MKFRNFAILLAFTLTGHAFATNAREDNNWFGYLDEETVIAARNRASQPDLNLEQYIASPEQNFPWITLKEVSCINPKTKQEEEFIIANVCRKSSPYGEFALYDGKTNPLKICLSGLTGFSDVRKDSACYLSTATYQYFPKQEDQKDYIVIESVNSGFNAGGKGYAQVCLDAFLKHFILPQTSVDYVFSDLRAGATQHYFPKYGFEKGLPAGFETLTKKLTIPYYYKKQS